MRYYVTFEGARGASDSPREIAVDLVDLPNGALEVRVDGRPVDVDVQRLEGRLSVRIDGRVFDLATEGQPPEFAVLVRGLASRVRVESARTRSASEDSRRAPRANDNVVRSPMPGRVVHVLVAEGQTVQPGQGLVVLEAMKMENEVRSRAPGIVKSVHVAPGAAVERDAPLVSLS